jgi:hypothetical protein
MYFWIYDDVESLLRPAERKNGKNKEVLSVGCTVATAKKKIIEMWK